MIPPSKLAAAVVVAVIMWAVIIAALVWLL